MIQIPDVSPYLSKGALGALVFIVVTGMGIAAWLTLKVITTLNPKTNGHGKSADGNLAAQQIQLREVQTQRDQAQKQLDELKAGSQPVEFWVRKYDESATRANQPVLRNQEEIMRTLREVVESQRRIRIRLKMEEEDG